MRLMLLLCLFAAPAAAQVTESTPVVASDSLRDVALTRLEHGRPVIYYNPVLLNRLGPQLTRFFLMHERGHVAAGHTGSALAGPTWGGTSARLRQELDADCWAAERLLANGDTEAVEAAIEFFLQLGRRRHDMLHPTGSQRAAKLLGCLPDR